MEECVTHTSPIMFVIVIRHFVIRPELSTGRMDPRVGSGHDFAGFWRVGSALQIFKFFLLIFKFFTDYFLVPESI